MSEAQPEPEPGAEGLLVAEHVEARMMGEHVREFRFKEPVLLHKVQVLGRGDRPYPGSSFEGRTYPNVSMLTNKLSVYAADKVVASSTMPRLTPVNETPGSFVPATESLVTTSVVVRGEYLKLSVAIYGRRPGAGEMPEATFPDITSSLPSHLRPVAAFEADKLDLAGSETAADALGPILDSATEASDVGAPTSLARALVLPSPPEANARIGEHTIWVASLPEEPDVLEADVVVGRLEELIRDFGKLAQGAVDAGAAHITQGTALARALLTLISRNVSRLEFRVLKAALRALAASLCVAPTVAEVLKRGGLAIIVGIIKDGDWCQLGHKIAALQALLQLCTHAVGMEAFLGWSIALEASTGVTYKNAGGGIPDHATGYDLLLALVAECQPGLRQLEPMALVLLSRAAFYAALARLDSSCARLAAPEAENDAGADEVLRGVMEALTDVAALLEELSTGGRQPYSKRGEAGLQGETLLDDEGAFAQLGDGTFCRTSSAGLLLGGLSAMPGCKPPTVAEDPFQRGHPQLHGFIESFVAGRRLIPNLCVIIRRLQRLSPLDRLATYVPLRRLICGILACVGGAHFLASEVQALNTLVSLLEGISGSAPNGAADCSGLPAIPRFPGPLALSPIGVTQLASLVTVHVRATRLALMLVSRTRQSGKDGLLPEPDALPLLSALHQLCARGSAGAGSVVCAFRSAFLVEWLLRQLEGRLDEVGAMGSAARAPPQPSVRHVVAILYTLVLRDPTASVAERFGARILGLATRALDLLEVGASSADGADGNNWGRSSSSLEFALDSDEGSLGRAVRVGRRGADVPFLTQLRELVAQLRPWQQAEGEPAPPTSSGELVSTAKLIACLQMLKGPRALKRSTREERSHQLALLLGGYSGSDRGVEVGEVDFAGDDADEQKQLPDEQYPPGDLMELPLLSMRLLCRRAMGGAREALAVALTEDRRPSGPARDGVTVLVPILIRCASALRLNLEALIVQEQSATADGIYKVQQAHAEILEAALQTLYHLLGGLREAGVSYRHTELLHVLFLIADRLTANLVGTLPGLAGCDPDFRILWRHCLVWVCRVFRVWVQSYPANTAGQLLQPLMRHARVLPMHYAPGLLLLWTCGSMASLVPEASHSFAIVPGRNAGEPGPGELPSRPLSMPVSTRGGALGQMVLKVIAPERESPFSKVHQDRSYLWGQLWGTDCEAQEWDMDSSSNNALNGGASFTNAELIRALGRKPHTAAVAAALRLVSQVNARRDRLLMDDVGEVAALLVQVAVTSDAMLHLLVVRVLEKLTDIGVPVLTMVLRLGETALHGAGGRSSMDTEQSDGVTTWAFVLASSDNAGGAAKDQRDARAVSRLLMLLENFGRRSPIARRALVEHRAEALCLSVLSHGPTTLPPATPTQAIRVLALVFCPSEGSSGKLGEGGKVVENGAFSHPAVPKCRMVTKALSLLLNRSADDGQVVVGPATVAAALELLLRLNSIRSLCLNLLFSVSEESATEESRMDFPVPVTLSCAFRLPQCAQRLARELAVADERWDATVGGSEAETEAEEILSAWLQVGELLVTLCRSVLVNCPTACVFLSILTPGGVAPDGVDSNTLRGVLADVQEALGRISERDRSEAIRVRATTLVSELRTLHTSLLDMNQGPPPTSLPYEELFPRGTSTPAGSSVDGAGAAKQGGAAEANGAATATSGGDGVVGVPSSGSDDEVLVDLVELFDAMAELEGTAEWLAAAELDSTDEAMMDSSSAGWEFDAVAHRRKRQAALEKMESDRQAKRLKLAQRADDRGSGARREDVGRQGAQGQQSNARRHADASNEKEKPSAPKSGTTSSASPPAATVPSRTSPEAPPSGMAPEAPAGNPSTAATTLATGPPTAAGTCPAVALKSFLKDHPEFMRVLHNPKKCLSDPRVKSMFVSELQNYPAVKSFLTTKGLNIN